MTAKDMALAVIARFGTEGANGCAVEFCGEAVTALDIEARMTLCNMAAEFGAFTAVVGARREDDRVGARPSVRAQGRGDGAGGRSLAHALLRTPMRVGT